MLLSHLPTCLPTYHLPVYLPTYLPNYLQFAIPTCATTLVFPAHPLQPARIEWCNQFKFDLNNLPQPKYRPLHLIRIRFTYFRLYDTSRKVDRSFRIA
jgi:hypothetical protein